jgi:Rieske Fe-S protein
MIAIGVHGEAAPFAAALTPGRPSAVQRARPAREAWGRLRRSIAVASLPPLPTLPLPPGSGMVARRGANPVAMSCDLDGTTTMLSARCGHAGCVVRFNDAELNWECACHGSRFGLAGAVLDGPATRPLAPYHLGA